MPPIVSITTSNADLAVEGATPRKTCFGTDNHLMGDLIGAHGKRTPGGDTFLAIDGQPRAVSILPRAEGTRGPLPGQKDPPSPGECGRTGASG